MTTKTQVLKMEEPTRLAELDNEIDLISLLRSILRVWKQWVISVLLVALLFITVQVLQYIFDDPTISYEKAIKFTFPGVEGSVYPNQSPFSLEDIISPAVISEVFDHNRLAEYGFSIERFRAVLSIEAYAPTYHLIVQKFNGQLSEKLTTSEIQALESQMTNELELATSGAALVSLTLERNELPEAVISKVLSDIPNVWASRVIRDKGVMNLNVQLASSSSMDDSLISNVDYLIVGDLLKAKMELVKDNITRLLQFDGASTISDPVTGIRLADLQNRVGDLQYYVIDELMSPIRSLGLTKNRQLSLFYYQDKRMSLTDELNLQYARAALVKEAFESYSSNQQLSSEQDRQLRQSDLPVVSSLPEADVFDKILTLSSESKTEEFRQSLSKQWLELNMNAAELKNQIAEVDRAIAILGSSDESSDKSSESTGGNETHSSIPSLKENHLKRTVHTLPGILDQIREYLDITQRIYQQLSAENVGTTGRLYRAITERPFVKSERFDIQRQVFVLLGLIFLTTIIVVPACMIRNAMERSPRT